MTRQQPRMYNKYTVRTLCQSAVACSAKFHVALRKHPCQPLSLWPKRRKVISAKGPNELQELHQNFLDRTVLCY